MLFAVLIFGDQCQLAACWIGYMRVLVQYGRDIILIPVP